MTCEDLSFLADALLSLCERDDTRPFYSERGIRIKQKLAEIREPLYAHHVLSRGDEPLLRRECEAVFTKARLTERQTDVLHKRLEGWTFEEIGQSGGHSKQGAQHIFVQALKKLTRSFRVYPFRGLSEVYWRETHRGCSRTCSGRISTNVLR